MKSMMQIAMECDTRYNAVKDCVNKLKIKGVKFGENSRRLFFDKYQEELIHENLYFEGKITEITLESKMNYE
jgi:hypothetical protein